MCNAARTNELFLATGGGGREAGSNHPFLKQTHPSYPCGRGVLGKAQQSLGTHTSNFSCNRNMQIGPKRWMAYNSEGFVGLPLHHQHGYYQPNYCPGRDAVEGKALAVSK